MAKLFDLSQAVISDDENRVVYEFLSAFKDIYTQSELDLGSTGAAKYEIKI